jgi:hypothetical protein
MAMRTWKKVVVALLAGLFAVALFFVLKIGPRNVYGMLRYDERREGDLAIGHPAPDVSLVSLDGRTRVQLADWTGAKPLILVFGSYT